MLYNKLQNDIRKKIGQYEKARAEAEEMAKAETAAGYMARGREIAYSNILLDMLRWTRR
jgi:hypothetical protein